MVDSPDDKYRVRAIARDLGWAPSSVHRVFSMLEADALVKKEGDGSYALGLEFYRMAWRATTRLPFRSVTRAVLQELASSTNESAFLCLYEPTRGEMMFADRVEGDHELRHIVRLNQWVPVHAGASGLAIVAFLPEDERARVIKSKRLKAVTPATLTDPERLAHALDQVRKQGYAISHGQRTPGAVGIAAPIWDASGRVVGDIGVTIPEQRYRPKSEPGVAAAVMRAASKTTQLTGGRPAA
jgi:DNA-binding IclR family transcriptional regulator